jgi:hypothetical protein
MRSGSLPGAAADPGRRVRTAALRSIECSTAVRFVDAALVRLALAGHGVEDSVRQTVDKGLSRILSAPVAATPIDGHSDPPLSSVRGLATLDGRPLRTVEPANPREDQQSHKPDRQSDDDEYTDIHNRGLSKIPESSVRHNTNSPKHPSQPAAKLEIRIRSTKRPSRFLRQVSMQRRNDAKTQSHRMIDEGPLGLTFWPHGKLSATVPSSA